MSQLQTHPFGPRDDMAGDELSGLENPEPGSYGDPPLFGPPFVRFVVDAFAGVRRELAHLGNRLVPVDRWWRNVGTVLLDANGNGTVELYIVPEGYELFLHRLYVNDNVSTFGAPTSSGGGYLSLVVDGQEEDGISLGSPGLPQVFTSSSSAALVLGPGERIEVKIHGATANRSVTCVARGRLIRSHLERDEP